MASTTASAEELPGLADWSFRRLRIPGLVAMLLLGCQRIGHGRRPHVRRRGGMGGDIFDFLALVGNGDVIPLPERRVPDARHVHHDMIEAEEVDLGSAVDRGIGFELTDPMFVLSS